MKLFSFIAKPHSPIESFIFTAAAAAKSLQSCPTLCNPRDGSPPGSPVPGILQARTLEWVAIFLLQYMKVKVKSLSHVRLLATPWTAARRASLSITTPGACSNSCPSSRWCHPTISSSVIPFSSHPQSFPASGSYQMSQLFASGGQSIGVSTSTSVLPMNEYSGLISFRMDWLDLLAIQGTLKSLFQHHSSKASILRWSAFFIVQLSQTQHNQK